MIDGKVLHATQNQVHVLRFVGDIRYTLSPSIDRFLKELLSGPPPSGFVIDLTETDSIDSTNLGLLARIAKAMKRLNGSRVTIVSNRPDINSILSSMAFDEVFEIVSQTAMKTEGENELTCQRADKESLSRTMIETHRALMELSEENKKMFCDVVAELEKCMGKD